MRKLELVTAIVLVVAVGAPAIAGSKHTYTRVDEFSWTDDHHALALHSENDGGVVVTRAEPAPFHGLQRGDVILAVDGNPVQQVEQVTRALRGRTSSVALRVRRGKAETTLVWSHADYRMFAPSPPPAPPAPPPPPSTPHN